VSAGHALRKRGEGRTAGRVSVFQSAEEENVEIKREEKKGLPGKKQRCFLERGKLEWREADFFGTGKKESTEEKRILKEGVTVLPQKKRRPFAIRGVNSRSAGGERPSSTKGEKEQEDKEASFFWLAGRKKWKRGNRALNNNQLI